MYIVNFYFFILCISACEVNRCIATRTDFTNTSPASSAPVEPNSTIRETEKRLVELGIYP